VLIVPPDKSMAVIFNNGEVCVIESHTHGLYGAVIGTCFTKKIEDFVAYLQLMVMRDFNSTLDGSNFALLAIDL